MTGWLRHLRDRWLGLDLGYSRLRWPDGSPRPRTITLPDTLTSEQWKQVRNENVVPFKTRQAK